MFKAFDKGKTFRPKRNHKVGTKRYELHKYAQATLGAGNLHDAVTLPDGEDVNEWLAVNTVDFFNEINLLYGIIAEFCTEQACPIMCAGPKYEYMWADGMTIKKPISCSAPRYVDYLLTWVQVCPHADCRQPPLTLHASGKTCPRARVHSEST